VQVGGVAGNYGGPAAFLTTIGVRSIGTGHERTDLTRFKLPGIAAALIVVALLAAGLLAGCGSNEAQARQFLDTAHEKSKQVALNEQKLIDQGKRLTDFFNSIQNITPETAAAMKGFFNDLVKIVDAINTSAQATKPEYDKILELNDVTDFKKYARNKLEVLTLIDRRSQLVRQFAAIYNTVIDQAVNGQPINEELVKNETTPILAERDKITKEIEQLNTQAADIAKDLKIEF